MSRTIKSSQRISGLRLPATVLGVLIAAFLPWPEKFGTGFTPSSVSAQAIGTSTLVPVADSTVRLLAPFGNDGGATVLSVSSASIAGLERSLVRFDQGSIATAVGTRRLVSATVEMTITGIAANWLGGRIGIHQMVLKPWVEAGATWSCANDTYTGLLGDLFNNCTNANRWGMDWTSWYTRPFETTPTDYASLVSASGDTVSFDVTADVQSFLAGEANLGWALIGTQDLISGSWVQLGSRESTRAPRLILTYETPPPPPVPGADEVRVSVPATSDTFISEAFPDWPREGSTRLKANSDQALFTKHALVAFTNSSINTYLATAGVDAGYELESAALVMTVKDRWPLINLGHVIDAHRVTVPWTAAGATWRCAVDANPSNLSTNCADATAWNMLAAPASRPYVATPTASLPAVTSYGGEMSFDVTTDVAQMRSGALPNNGWLIQKPDQPWLGFISFFSIEGGIPPRLDLVFRRRADLGEVCDPDSASSLGRDEACVPGLVCGQANGEGFGLDPEVGVCWSPQCENEIDDPSEANVDCGGDCGSCAGRCSDQFCRVGEAVLPDPTDVLAFANGAFVRASSATYQVGEARVEHARVNTLRFEDRGDEHGRVALFEGERTNHLRQSSYIAGPAWLTASTAAELPMALSAGFDGPDGTSVVALIAEEGADGSPRQRVTGPRAAGVVSVWQRANPAGASFAEASRFHVISSTSATRLGAGADWDLTRNWARFDASVAASTTDADVFFAHHEDFPVVGMHGLPEVEFEVWGFQWEDGAFPSSYIPTQASASTRAPDQLTFPAAIVPTWMRNGIWQIDVLPEFASTEMVAGRRYNLVSFGGNDDALYLLDGRIVVRTAGTVRLNLARSWARHDKLTITLDAINARVTVRSASGSESVHPVSAFAFPAQPVRIGGSYGVTGSEAFARISEPRRVTAASQACVPDTDYCSAECPCDEGQGPCTDDVHCGARLVCTPNAGARYGLPPAFGVCEHPSCLTPAAATVCGATTARCGLCEPGCTADCNGRSCGPNRCGGSCGAECGPGEGGAESSLDCAPGLVLGIAMGAQFDLPAELNVCVDPVCLSLRSEEIPCGSVTDTCGRCPICVPHCDGRVCGDNGCGGSCGTCATGTCSDAGYCAAPSGPTRFPPPPDMDLSTAPVGTLPGSFAVNHAGEATYSVPLAVPPGRGGIEPNLALTYNSSRDNGYLGLGWSIEGFSSIARCNRTVAVDGYADAPQFLASDALCLDGTRLVATTFEGSETEVAVNFRLESDKYMLIRGYYVVDSSETFIGPMYFRAWTKDGRVMEFGGHENAVVHGVDRSDQPQVARWLLRSIADRTNNTMYVLYAHRVNGMSTIYSTHGREVEYYPKTVVYGPLEKPFSVNFVYDFDTAGASKRADARSAWRNGTNVHVDHLLERIDVYVDGDVLREYKFAYDPGTGRGEPYLLESVQQCDSAGVCMPPTSFAYDTRAAARAPVLEALPEPVVPGASIFDLLAAGTRHFAHEMISPPVDLNGDGIDDFLYHLLSYYDEGRDDYQWDIVALMSNGQVGASSHTYVHTGVTSGFNWRYTESGGFFGLPVTRSVATVQSTQPLGFFDYNNDGRTDMLVATSYRGGTSRYRVLSYNGQSFNYYDTEIDYSFEQPGNTYLLDVDGDGFQDMVRCGPDSAGTSIAPAPATWRVYLNPQGRGFGIADEQTIESDAPCRASSVVLDANGDGREELLVKLRDLDIADDHGTWNLEAEPPSLLLFFEPDGAVSYVETNAPLGHEEGLPSLIDVNGDGLQDVLGWSTRTAQYDRVWISVSVNRGDGRFNVARQHLDFRFSDLDAYPRRVFANRTHKLDPYWLQARVVDVDRDGKQDLVGRFGSYDVYFSSGHMFDEAADTGLLDDTFIEPTDDPNLSKYDIDYDRDYDRDGWPELGFHTRGHIREVGMHPGYRVVGAPKPKLRRVTDGFGALVTVDYGLLSDPAVHSSELYESDGSPACGYPFICRLNMSNVVLAHAKDEGVGGIQDWEHSYGGARTGAEGRGFLGFGDRIVEESTLSVDVSTTTYVYDNRSQNDLNDFPFAFLPVSRVTYTHLADSEYVESEHRTYVSTYPHRSTVLERVVGTDAPVPSVITRNVYTISDIGVIFLSRERDEIALHDNVYGNVLARTQTLSDNETRYQTTSYKHQSTPAFADAWLINLPAIHEDRYIYEGKQEVAKRTDFEYYGTGKMFSRTEETGLINGALLHREWARGRRSSIERSLKSREI